MPLGPVDVCICTYRRNSVVETLRSVAGQDLPEGMRLRVIVVDNDDTASAQARVQATAASLGLDCRYVHAPAHNISVARNAALDAAAAELVAFIDDDETAAPRWIAGLIAALRDSGAAVVLGPVDAVYGEGPRWLHQADLRSIRPVWRAGGVIDTGYSSNVMLDRAVMTEAMCRLRFDPAFGRTGGEDTVFFAQLHRLGARIVFAGTATVREAVTPPRAGMRWLLRRAYRSGQTHAWMLLETRRWKLWLLVLAVAKCAFCVVCALGQAPWTARWRRHAVRTALHAGVASRLAGMRVAELY